MSEAASPSSFYKVGGALPQGVPSYIKRESDDILFESLKAGEFCYVLNSRQMGKTSLMVRTLARLRSEGWAGIIIDFSAKDSQVDRPDRWYDGIINQLNRQFGLLDRQPFRSWLKERDFIAPVERLAEFIETVLLPSRESSIVIFIDEIDSTLGLPFTDDFFALIRSCYNKRAENPDYRRLTFALLGVAAPSELIGDAKRTPFNVGESIDLKGFEFEEALPLAAGLEGKADHPKVVLREILYWTGGQPFLTQRLCQLVADSNFPIASGSETTQVRGLVESRLIQNWESQDHQEHLKTIRKRLLDNEQKAGYLLEIYRQIRHSEDLPASNQPEERELQLSGLVVKRDNRLRVYNPIYAAVFDDDWIDAELRKLRPYSESFRAWFTSGKTDSSRLLRGGALIEAEQWATEKATLSAEDREFLAASSAQQREEEITAKEREAELARERTAREAAEAAEQTQAEANRRAQRKIRQGSLVLGASLVAATILGTLSILSGSQLRVARAEAGEARRELEQAQEELLQTDEQRKASIEELELVKSEREEAEIQLNLAESQVNQTRRKLENAQNRQQDAEASARDALIISEEAIQAKENARQLTTEAQAELKNAQQDLAVANRELDELTRQQSVLTESIASVNKLSDLIGELYSGNKAELAEDATEQLGLSFTDFTGKKNDFKQTLLNGSIALALLYLDREREAADSINESIELIERNSYSFEESEVGRLLAFLTYFVYGNMLEELDADTFPSFAYEKAFSYVGINKNITEENLIDAYIELWGLLPDSSNGDNFRSLASSFLQKYYDLQTEKLIQDLEVALSQGDWQEADRLTWEAIVTSAFAKDVMFFSYGNVSCSSLKSINELWYQYSSGRFGFEIQKEIFLENGGLLDSSRYLWNLDFLESYYRFSYEVGWLYIEGDTENFDALLSRQEYDRIRFKERDEIEWNEDFHGANINAGHFPFPLILDSATLRRLVTDAQLLDSANAEYGESRTITILSDLFVRRIDSIRGGLRHPKETFTILRSDTSHFDGLTPVLSRIEACNS